MTTRVKGCLPGGVVAGALATCLVAAAASSAPALAETGPLRLSIADALQRAQETSNDVAVARSGVERARGEEIRARADWFPQIGASASYDRTLASEFEGLFGGAAPMGMAGMEGMPLGGFPSGLQDLPFGRKNIYRLNLSASQTLFTGGRLTGRLRLARSGRSTAALGLSSARAQAALAAAEAYYDAVLAERLVAISVATLEQAERTLAQTRLGKQVGAQPEFELLRAQVTVGNQRAAAVQAAADRDLAILRLRQRLDLAPDRPLSLSTTLDEEALSGVDTLARQTADVPAQPQREGRAAVRQAAEAVRMREAGLRVARSQHIPSLTLSSQYGRVNYPEEVFPTSFDDWRTNWTVGLVLQIPIFQGFRVRGDTLVAAADLEEARARLGETEELARLDGQSAEARLRAARASWEATAGTVEQARRAHEIAELRYREGVSTQLELSDARILLQQAEANRARAARDLQVARVRIALLPNLPLATGGVPPQGAPSMQPGTGASAQTGGGGPAPAGIPGAGGQGAPQGPPGGAGQTRF